MWPKNDTRSSAWDVQTYTKTHLLLFLCGFLLPFFLSLLPAALYHDHIFMHFFRDTAL